MSYRGVVDYLADRVNDFGVCYAVFGSATLAFFNVVAATCRDAKKKVSSRIAQRRLEKMAG